MRECRLVKQIVHSIGDRTAQWNPPTRTWSASRRHARRGGRFGEDTPETIDLRASDSTNDLRRRHETLALQPPVPASRHLAATRALFGSDRGLQTDKKQPEALCLQLLLLLRCADFEQSVLIAEEVQNKPTLGAYAFTCLASVKTADCVLNYCSTSDEHRHVLHCYYCTVDQSDQTGSYFPAPAVFIQWEVWVWVEA